MPDYNRFTKKLYYQDPLLQRCPAIITQVGEDYLELSQTVAYPEGGGQESDQGWIDTPQGTLAFAQAILVGGDPITLDGFKGGSSGGVIQHKLDAPNPALLQQLKVGDAVHIRIHIERRQKLSLSHSASHFLYAAVLHFRPELEETTIGCHIKESGARFDFISSQSFSPDDVKKIEEHSNYLISQNNSIEIKPHPLNEEARSWLYQDITIPCGGTHLASPADIRAIKVSRKNIGKNKERLSCTFENCIISTGSYHSVAP